MVILYCLGVAVVSNGTTPILLTSSFYLDFMSTTYPNDLLPKSTKSAAVVDKLALPSPPVNLKIAAAGEVSADNSVEIQISWNPPTPDAIVDLYTVS